MFSDSGYHPSTMAFGSHGGQQQFQYNGLDGFSGLERDLRSVSSQSAPLACYATRFGDGPVGQIPCLPTIPMVDGSGYMQPGVQQLEAPGAAPAQVTPFGPGSVVAAESSQVRTIQVYRDLPV